MEAKFKVPEMKKTKNGYTADSKYFVHVCYGHIEYFVDLSKAMEVANYHEVEVGIMTHKPSNNQKSRSCQQEQTS